MILIDTSVWVDYFRGRAQAEPLTALLEQNEALLHPWVLGELALGNLGSRSHDILRDLRRLPAAPRARDPEVLDFIQVRRLSGRGLGWVDAQLLASALISGAGLWTMDRSLARLAAELGCAA